MILLWWLTFLFGFLFVTVNSSALLDLFISSDDSICFTMAFPPVGTSDHVVISVFIDFPISWKQDAPFQHSLLLFLCWLWWSMWSFERCSMGGYLQTLLLLLPVNFVSGFRLELMYVSLIVSTRSNLTHLHGWQQFVLLPYFIKKYIFLNLK